MQITMLDTVETGHAIIPELEAAEIKPQAGLAIKSEEPTQLAGMPARHYVLLLAKGAELDLPDRLAKRLLANKHAKRRRG